MRRLFCKFFLISVIASCFATPLTECPCGRIINTMDSRGISYSYSRTLTQAINDKDFHYTPIDGHCYQTIEYVNILTDINITILYNRMGEFEKRLQAGYPNTIEFGEVVRLTLKCDSVESCLALATNEIRVLTNNFVVYDRDRRVRLTQIQINHLKAMNYFVKFMRDNKLAFPPRTLSYDHKFIEHMSHFHDAINNAKFMEVEELPEVVEEPEPEAACPCTKGQAPQQVEQSNPAPEPVKAPQPVNYQLFGVQITRELLYNVIAVLSVLLTGLLTYCVILHYKNKEEEALIARRLNAYKLNKEILDECNRMDHLIGAMKNLNCMVIKLKKIYRFAKMRKALAAAGDRS